MTSVCPKLITGVCRLDSGDIKISRECVKSIYPPTHFLAFASINQTQNFKSLSLNQEQSEIEALITKISETPSIRTSKMAASIGGRGGREGSSKSAMADQISQSLQSTANILHLMRQTSPSHAQLMKLPKKLLAKTSMIKNTELVLKHMPRVISSLDEHVESGLQSVAHLDIVVQLLSNMCNIQLRSLSTLLEDEDE